MFHSCSWKMMIKYSFYGKELYVSYFGSNTIEENEYPKEIIRKEWIAQTSLVGGIENHHGRKENWIIPYFAVTSLGPCKGFSLFTNILNVPYGVHCHDLNGMSTTYKKDYSMKYNTIRCMFPSSSQQIRLY